MTSSEQFTPTGGQTIFPRINFIKDRTTRLLQRISNGRVAMYFKRLFGDASLDLNFASSKSLEDSVSGNNLITFSRASSGTYVGSDGLIKTSVVNYARNSEQVGLWALSKGSVSANSAESPVGDLTADKWIPDTTSNYHFTKLTTTLSSTSSVTYSIYAKQAGYRYLLVNTTAGSSSGNAGPVVDLQDGVVIDNFTATYSTTVTDAGNGWWRIVIPFTGNGVNITVDHNPLPTSTIAAYSGDNTSGVLLWGAQLQEGTTATDYIPTGATISGAPRFDHDPVTGESLGLLIEEERTNLFLFSDILISQSIASTEANCCFSFYGTGTITLSGAATGSLVGAGANERVSLVVPTTDGTITATVSGRVTNAQAEIGSFPTSYIPTSGSAVTRAPDIASIEGTNFSSWYNQSEGTVFADFQTYSTSTQQIIALTVGTSNSTRWGVWNNQLYIAQSGGQYFSSLTPSTSPTKTTFAVASNDAIGASNGSLTAQDTTVVLPTPDNASIGRTAGSQQLLSGHISRLAYFPTRKTDQELIDLTKP